MPNKLTKSEFIDKARKAHGDKYDYSKVEYLNNRTKICIICPIHGEFWQLPSGHLLKYGCKKCSNILNGLNKRLTISDFIAKARKIHGDKYGYDLVSYTKYNSDISIICPIHGVFIQKAINHLTGRGCNKCRRDKLKNILYGVGINDYNGLVKIKDKHINSYLCWSSMLERCYSASHLKIMPTYKGCTVCDEWKYFSNFKAWFDNPENGYKEGYHLDKDILVKGNKVYSPNTCCFVPNEINAIFKTYKHKKYPTGVRLRNGRIAAIINKYGKEYFLGYFDDAIKAKEIYEKERKAYIKDLADIYFKKGLITKTVHNSMNNYE